MLFTPIRKKVYVLGLACILFTQALAYSQAHNLSQFPVPMLLVLLDGQSNSVTNSANTNNTNPGTNAGNPSTDNNQVQVVATNEVQAVKESGTNEAQPVKESVTTKVQAIKEAGNNEVQTMKEKVGAPEDPDSPKISQLKTLIIEESQKAGLIKGIVNGVVILYSSMSDLVLYPVLTTVLAILVIGLILFIVFIMVALKKENFDLMNKLLIFGGFHTILLINLLFILYEQRKITIKFFSFDKDILLVICSAVIGYFIGRYYSRQIFEDKALP